MAVFIHHLDTGMSEQLNMILHDEEKEDAGERIGEVIKGFSYAVSRLLNIDEKTVEEVTLTDIMLDQYLRILEKETKREIYNGYLFKLSVKNNNYILILRYP